MSRSRPVLRWPPFGKKGPVVPVIRLTGVIGAGGGRLRGAGLSLEGLNTSIERAFKAKDAKAVALAINSPGGSPVQSASDRRSHPQARR